MVHTRGQPRFTEGDRVLCYEPDVTKVQVLYEAKVLEVVEKRDGATGRRTIECLVHFQGWNASWDRFVAEDQILEYNEVNRRLQRALAEKFLPPGVVERRRYSGAESQASSGGYGGGGVGASGSVAASETASGAESDDEPPPVAVHIEMPLTLRKKLDDDYYFVNKYHKLHQLPCGTSVVQLLEAYVHHWHQMYRHAPAKHSKQKDAWSEAAVRSVSLCKEVVDGLRVTFDHVLELQLLYAPERDQQARWFRAPSPPANRHRQTSGRSDKTDDSAPRMRLRSRRSAQGSTSPERAASSEDEEPEVKRRLFSVDSSASSRGASELAAWSLLPPSELSRNPPLPCTVYGATHLLRLIALLPELLQQMHLSERKLNLVMHHVSLLIAFLQDAADQLCSRANYK